MATSFRFNTTQYKKLEFLSKELGTSKAQVVNEAINKLYDEYMEKSPKSMLDVLIEGGFKPIALDLKEMTHDSNKQRQQIRDYLSKKHNNR